MTRVRKTFCRKLKKNTGSVHLSLPSVCKMFCKYCDSWLLSLLIAISSKIWYPGLPNCTKFKSAADVKSQRAKYKGDIHMATSSDLSIQGTKNWRWVGDQLIPNFAFFSWVLGWIVVTFSAHSSSLVCMYLLSAGGWRWCSPSSFYELLLAMVDVNSSTVLGGFMHQE